MDWSALQICMPDSILLLAVFQDGAVTLKTEYLEALRGLQWRQRQDQPLFSNGGTKKFKLTVYVFTCPLHENTWFTTSVQIFWWSLQGKHSHDIFNSVFGWNSCTKAPTLTLGIGKPCLHFISGWLRATWDDKLYKILTRFLSPFTVFSVSISVHNIVKPFFH